LNPASQSSVFNNFDRMWESKRITNKGVVDLDLKWFTYTCLWLQWFACYKTWESSTQTQKFEWLCWLAAMTSETVWSCKAAKISHFCSLLVFSKQLKESTCWGALLLSKLPDRQELDHSYSGGFNVLEENFTRPSQWTETCNKTIAIFVIPDGRCHARKGSIEAFLGWIPGEATCFTVWVWKVFHGLIISHRMVLEYHLGVFYGFPVMTLVTWRGLWVRWPRPPTFGPGGNVYVNWWRLINVKLLSKCWLSCVCKAITMIRWEQQIYAFTKIHIYTYIY
jgi:hypothetical protein